MSIFLVFVIVFFSVCNVKNAFADIGHEIESDCIRDLTSHKQICLLHNILCMNQTHYLKVNDGKRNSSQSPQITIERYQKMHGLSAAVVSPEIVRNFTFRAGPWFHFDTWVIGAQFGHFISKFMQYYGVKIILENCGYVGNIKILMTHLTKQMARSLSSENYRLIMSLSLGTNSSLEMLDQENIVFAEKLESRHKQFQLLSQPSCFSNVIDWNNYETTFLSRYVASKWRENVYDQYKQIIKYPLSECPKHVRVISLIRNEGTCMRYARNLFIIDSILRRYGLTYENITFDSKASIPTILDTFSNFSLLISSHSSSLKNLIFARKGAAVIELRPGENDVRNPRNPFSEGLEHSDVIFKVSDGHIFSNDTTFAMTYRDDFYIKPDVFERDLKNVIRAQQQLCRDIPFQPIASIEPN